MTTTSAPQLAFQEVGEPSATSTILFIHGAASDGQEWDLVIPNLKPRYHILLPDLPGHGASTHLAPFSIPRSAELLAELVREQARSKKAHIVGLSLGAHVAVAFASAYPDLAETVFVSGYSTFESMSTEIMARGLWLQSRLESWIPGPIVRWAMDGTDLRKQKGGAPTMELCRQISTPHTSSEPPGIRPWSARTLIIVAGKKDLLPTADIPDDAKQLRDLLSPAQSGKTKAVTHMEMRHPWSRQRPDLFAEAVRAWIEEGVTPDGFVEL